MESAREAYQKYLSSILIEIGEDIEPTTSEIEYQTTTDINGQIVIYSPLLGEKYRLWRDYSYVSSFPKYGHVIAHKFHSYDFDADSFIVNIKTGESHKLDSSTYTIIGDNKLLGKSGNNLFIADFKGDIVRQIKPGESVPDEEEPKMMPRREGIKTASEEGFFKTKYVYNGIVLDVKPILDYDGNIICYKDGEIYLYDKSHSELRPLCSLDEFDYSYNSIFINDKRYMLFKGKLIDVTDYPDIDKYMLSSKLINVLDYTEFKLLYETSPEYQAELEKAKNDRKRVLAEQEEARKRKELLEETKKAEERKEEAKKAVEKTHQEIIFLYKKYLEQIAEYEKLGDDNPFAGKKMIPITPDILFIEVDGHKEIDPFFRDNHLLRYADLSLIDFSGVKLDHTECLAYTNANIDPQTVFNKDLSYSDLRGIYHTMDNFDGVNMEGTIVDKDKLDFVSNLSDETIISERGTTDPDMTLEEATDSLSDKKKS